jgi:predicted ferric reductase
MFSSHPFTAASAPEDGRLEFVIKPAKGMTRALMSKVQRAGQTSGTGSDGREMEVRVLLDGPYGGIGGDIGVYDRMVLVAGGSGRFSYVTESSS